VHARGLDVIDGLLTTHAELIEIVDGVEVFRASWIRQGRGLSIHSESGFISRSQNLTFHGSTVKSVISGIRRKLTMQGMDPAILTARRTEAAAKRATRAAAQIDKLISLISLVSRWDLAKIGHVRVTRRDSLKAGNCVSGTDEFITRFFPDRSPDSETTIAEMVERSALVKPVDPTGNKLTLARQIAAACLIAIRRDRRAIRNLMV
jgi:hypothetical protein